MLSTRWIKLLRDLQATPWRIAIMLLTMALGIFVFAGLLSSYSLLTTEVRANYLATNPAAASLQIDNIDSKLLEAVRQFPGVDQAQAGAVFKTSFSSRDGTPNPLLIFVVDDFNHHNINLITPEAGAWPPLQNTLLLERDSLARKGFHIGDAIKIPLRDGSVRELGISGTVHDPAMPVPSYAAYGYATSSALAAWGINIPLSDLQVTFRDKALNAKAAEKAAGELARWIESQGHKVIRIRVPPPGEHPHQGIILSVLGVFLFFSAIAFALSAIVIATIVDGLMAQQIRQIGIMKSIGASNRQIAGSYLTFIFILGFLATFIALPTAITFTRAFSKMVLGFLNFNLQNPALPIGLYAALIATGTLLPLLAAAAPIVKAINGSAQSSLIHTGAKPADYAEIRSESWLSFLPGIDRSLILALRNCFRRRGRLLLILTLLSSSGAMFITSLNLQKASQEHLENAAAERHYDLEIVLLHAEDSQKITHLIQKIEGVTAVEGWISTAVTPYRADGLAIENTHADGGHGTFTLNVMADNSQQLKLDMIQGQWSATIPEGEVILNHKAMESFPQTHLGDSIILNISGSPLRLKIAGIARQKMAGKMAYISASTYRALVDHERGYTSWRISTSQHDEKFIEAIKHRIETALNAAQIPLDYTITETRLRHEIDGHFTLLVNALRFIAILMAATGVFALASVMSIHVTERTREIGIMRSIGASSSLIVRNILIEGIFISLISWIMALALCIPLSKIASNYIGRIIFDEAFPLAISGAAIWTWLLAATTGAILASLYPAKKAVNLNIRECFYY